MFRVTVLAALVLLAGCSRPQTAPPLRETVYAPDAPRFAGDFWNQWGDGRAELAGYELTHPRYGQLRSGTAVTVFVTETFSNSLRVKSDPGAHPATDEFPAMKLNVIKDFQTGIYDYNTMLSAFVALKPVNGRPVGAAVKLSYSGQEWCGHVWHQLLFDQRSIRSTSHSYFDGEADREQVLDYPPDGLSEDALMLWARGMSGPILIPGETRDVALLTSLQTAREAHSDLRWTGARLCREKNGRTLTVPAGEFEVELWTVEVGRRPHRTFYVEKASPHRIVRWESAGGERAELLGSDRLEYWKLNGKGGEKELGRLGLRLRLPRTM